MHQEGLELYEKTSIMAEEQFNKLRAEEQDLYFLLQGSEPIYDLIDTEVSDDNVIINFKTTKESNRTYFTFDIAESVGIKYHPEILYKVNGSVLDGNQGKNIVYTIKHVKGNSIHRVYADNYTNINNKIVLNEVTYINTIRHMSRVEYVSLTIKKFPSAQNEKFIIDPESDIYKLYSSKLIDAATLCNFVLLQANHKDSKVVEDDELNFTKQLSKRFI